MADRDHLKFAEELLHRLRENAIDCDIVVADAQRDIDLAEQRHQRALAQRAAVEREIDALLALMARAAMGEEPQ